MKASKHVQKYVPGRLYIQRNELVIASILKNKIAEILIFIWLGMLLVINFKQRHTDGLRILGSGI